MNTQTMGNGQKAYFIRKATGSPWLEIANKLEYKTEYPDYVRQRDMLGLAKAYAMRRRFSWPLNQ